MAMKPKIVPQIGAVYNVKYFGTWRKGTFVGNGMWKLDNLTTSVIEEIGELLIPAPLEVKWGSDPNNIV
jgi:hypothetical protein